MFQMITKLILERAIQVVTAVEPLVPIVRATRPATEALVVLLAGQVIPLQTSHQALPLLRND